MIEKPVHKFDPVSELGKKTGIRCQNVVQEKNKHKCDVGKMLHRQTVIQANTGCVTDTLYTYTGCNRLIIYKYIIQGVTYALKTKSAEYILL